MNAGCHLEKTAIYGFTHRPLIENGCNFLKRIFRESVEPEAFYKEAVVHPGRVCCVFYYADTDRTMLQILWYQSYARPIKFSIHFFPHTLKPRVTSRRPVTRFRTQGRFSFFLVCINDEKLCQHVAPQNTLQRLPDADACKLSFHRKLSNFRFFFSGQSTKSRRCSNSFSLICLFSQMAEIFESSKFKFSVRHFCKNGDLRT